MLKGEKWDFIWDTSVACGISRWRWAEIPSALWSTGQNKAWDMWGSGLGDAHFPLLTFPSREGINYTTLPREEGFCGGSAGKESACQCRRHKRCRFDPWFGKIPWRRTWQPTLVFLPGESMDRGAWRLQSVGSQRAGHDWACTQRRKVREEHSQPLCPSLTPSHSLSSRLAVVLFLSDLSILRVPPRFQHTVSREGLLFFFVCVCGPFLKPLLNLLQYFFCFMFFGFFFFLALRHVGS